MNDNPVFSSDNAVVSKGIQWRKIAPTCLKVCGLTLILTICCGVGYYFFQQSVKLDPAQITAIQKEIVDIDLPASLHPGIGINRPLSFAKLKMAFYNPAEATSLMLIGFNEYDSCYYDDEIEGSVMACSYHANKYWNKDFQVESTDSKPIQIGGVQYRFTVIKGKIVLPGGQTTPGRLIFCRFVAKNHRRGFIRYSIAESDYDEAAVIKMLESIRK